ncbi:MAG: hypothetical protein ACRD4I_13160 [Candidatus Angelobacter sp.]
MRATFTFQAAGAGIGIHGYYKPSAEFLRRMKIAHVTDMQEIEAPVGQNDFLSRRAPLPDNLGKLGRRKELGEKGSQIRPPSRRGEAQPG